MADDGDEVVVVGPDDFVPVTGLSLGMEAELGEIVGTCALALAANRTAATDVVINRLAERHLRTFPGVTLGGFMTLIFHVRGTPVKLEAAAKVAGKDSERACSPSDLL
ncbi:MAG: hypothetical protein M3372_06955 [Verrucomicrobiota bacterium]|nr:hypothetical protein [Verrucomicrobiota bacterium]